MPSPRRELLALVVSNTVPVLGVLFLGWDARAAMFIIWWEVAGILTVSAWMFGYIQRSPVKGILMIIVTAPAGMLFLTLVVGGFESGAPPSGATFRDLLGQTWFSVLLVLESIAEFCRGEMARARAILERMPDRRIRFSDDLYEMGNRTGLNLVFRGMAPFFVLCLLLAAATRLSALALAGVLAFMLVVDVLFFLRQHRVGLRELLR